MKKMLFSACFAMICITTLAQTSTQRIIIKGGHDAWDNFMKEVFMYPSFQKGIVEYKNGQRFKSNMNYNKVLGTVQFIDEKGDTLSLSDEHNVASVNIATDFFYYNPMCVIAVKTDGKARLFKNERLRIADKLKTGGYGIPNTSGTIESIDRLDTKLGYNQIELNESLLISKVTTYYIENDKGEFLPASKKNLYNLYPKKDDQIKNFIKSNNLDFSTEEQFIKVTDFLSTL
jgi:hypothetical protein